MKSPHDRYRAPQRLLEYRQRNPWVVEFVLIISTNVVNSHQEPLYQPSESHVAHIIDSLPFTAASTATAALPRDAKMGFDWLTKETPARGMVSGNGIAQKEFVDRAFE